MSLGNIADSSSEFNIKNMHSLTIKTFDKVENHPQNIKLIKSSTILLKNVILIADDHIILMTLLPQIFLFTQFHISVLIHKNISYIIKLKYNGF